MDEIIIGLISVGITSLIGMFGVWWRTSVKQDGKIDSLRNFNEKDHRAIRQEMNGTKDLMTHQHSELKDEIHKVWKDLVRRNGGSK